MTLTRVVNGMHVANRMQYDVEKCIASARATGCVTILHHLMFEKDDVAQQWGDFENRYWYNKLRKGWAPQGIPPAPELLIHIRMYHPQWKHLDPRAWAQHSVSMLSNWRGPDGESANIWNDPYVCVSPANEQDIEDRPADTGANTVAEYAEMGRWNRAWAEEVNRLLPNRKALLCWPAFAGGHDAQADDPDSEYAVPEVRDAMRLYEIGAVHLYGHAEWGADAGKTMPGGSDQYWHMCRAFRPKGWRDAHQPSSSRPRDRGGFCAQFPGKPFVVSESGTFGHNNPALTTQTLAAWNGLLEAAALNGACLGVTPFIWNSDQSHPTNVIWSNEALRNAAPLISPYVTRALVPVRGAAPAPIPPTEEHPMTPLEVTIWEEADRVHRLRGLPYTPGNALVKAANIPAGVLLITTDEGRISVGTARYAWQRFQVSDTGAVVVKWCAEGDWGHVKEIRAPKA